MGLGDKWIVVDPIGKSGCFLLGWNKEVSVYQTITTFFNIEIEFETLDSEGKMCEAFIYTSNKKKVREDQ